MYMPSLKHYKIASGHNKYYYYIVSTLSCLQLYAK